jgi:hypothetical protein
VWRSFGLLSVGCYDFLSGVCDGDDDDDDGDGDGEGCFSFG